MARKDASGEPAGSAYAGKSRSAAGRLAAKAALAVLVLGAAVGLAVGVSRLVGGARFFEKDVSERFMLYVEGLRPSGKLVLVEGVQRYKASREFTARLLAVLRMDAKIEIEALADTAYYVDLSDPSRWKVSWSPRSRILSIRAPSPGLLPPAVRTDSIEVRTEGANLVSKAVFNLKREAEAMKAELSRDMLEQGRKALDDPGLRGRLESRLGELASAFCEQVLRVKPLSVAVSFE